MVNRYWKYCPSIKPSEDWARLSTSLDNQAEEKYSRQLTIIQIKCKIICKYYKIYLIYDLRDDWISEPVTGSTFYFYFILFKSGSYQMRLNFLKSCERYREDIKPKERFEICSQLNNSSSWLQLQLCMFQVVVEGKI